MNAIAAKRWKTTVDDLVLRQVPETGGASINDLAIVAGLKRGTVVASLKRLTAAEQVRRIWDGNERFGRFLYRLA